jgi:hypothetical protein
MEPERISVTTDQIAQLAMLFPANPVALTLAIESQGVGEGDFRLPTRELAKINFLPGWTRQNYRTAIANAIELGLFIRLGPSLPGRTGARYRMSRNGLETGPVTPGAA